VINKDKATRAEVLRQQRDLRKARKTSLTQLRLDSFLGVSANADAATSSPRSRALSRFQIDTNRRVVETDSDSEDGPDWGDSDEMDSSSEDELSLF